MEALDRRVAQVERMLGQACRRLHQRLGGIEQLICSADANAASRYALDFARHYDLFKSTRYGIWELQTIIVHVLEYAMLTHGNSREVAYKFHADCQDASSKGFKRFRATVEQDIAAIDAGAPAPLQPPPAPELTFVPLPELPNDTAEAGDEGREVRPSCATHCRCNRTPSARQRRCRQHGRGGGVMQATAPHPSHRSDDFSRGFGVLLFRNRSMGRALTFYTVLLSLLLAVPHPRRHHRCCTANARSAQRSPISGRRSSLMSSAVTSANGRCGPAAAGRNGHPRRSTPSPGSRISPATSAKVCCGVWCSPPC